MLLNKFIINKNEKVSKQTKILTNYINKKVNKKNFSKLSLYVSKTFNIPEDVIKFENKKFLSLNHNFINGTFQKKFKLKYLLIYIFNFFFLISIIFIFSKNKKKNKRVEIIFDEILSNDELGRAKKFLKNFKSYKIVTSSNVKKFDEQIIYSNQIGASRKLIKKAIFPILIIFFKTIILSIREKTNLLPILINLLKKIIKYETIFKNNTSDFLFQERSYNTCAVKNYIFKKYGGRVTACTQRIIFHLGNTSFFINTDVLFSLGKKTAKILKYTGSKIKKIIPMGSTVFETKWLNAKKTKPKNIDVIYIGGNNAPAFATDSKYINNYYEQLNWLKKLKYEFPKLKFVFKHHENNSFHDKRELSILKNSNIKRISSPTASGKLNYSYGYAINSKIRLTWCSTMGYELLGHGYLCYFLDPKKQNESFLHNYNFNQKFRVTTYYDLKKKIMKILKKNQDTIKNKSDFCLNSKNIDKKILSVLRNFR